MQAFLLRFIYILCFLFNIILLNNINAAQRIQINKGNINPIPIAVHNIRFNFQNEAKIGSAIIDIIKNDLSQSGLFKILPKESIIDSQTGVKHTPNFTAWKILNISAILNTEIKIVNNKIILQFILWDSITGRQIDSGEFEGTYMGFRKLAHTVANSVYEKIIGEKGYFNSKIAYVSISYMNNKRISRIAVMDYDGENHKFITNGKYLVNCPKFSPDGKMLAYVAYVGALPRVYVRNLVTGQETVIKNIQATFSPSFSPDGTKLLVSGAKDGATNVFEVDLYTQKYNQLTNNQFINTSALYSPNSDLIYFTSDYAKKSNIYVMDRNGFQLKAISTKGGNYAAPTISFNSEYIAASKQESGQFYVTLINLDDLSERKLTEGYVVDSPSFSPNGRLIAFSKTERVKVIFDKRGRRIKTVPEYLHVVDITGSYSYKIKTPFFGILPDWSRDLD